MARSPISVWTAPDPQAARLVDAMRRRHGAQAGWPVFEARLKQHVATLRDELRPLHGERADFEDSVLRLLALRDAAPSAVRVEAARLARDELREAVALNPLLSREVAPLVAEADRLIAAP